MGTNPRLSDWLPGHVLCISCVVQYFIYFVFLFLYIIFLQIVLFPPGDGVRVTATRETLLILFNMHFIILSILSLLKKGTGESNVMEMLVCIFSGDDEHF